MKPQLLFTLALLARAASFQTAPAVGTAINLSREASTATRLLSNLNDAPQENGVEQNKLIIPKTRRRRLLSNLTIRPLSALTQLKRDERIKYNRARLLKMGITTAAAFLLSITKSTVAKAATPLLVTKGGITPLISSPGMGLVEMPGMRGISPYQVGGLPNAGAMFFAFSLFFTVAVLRAAGDNYARLMHLMAQTATELNPLQRDDKEAEELELGLPKEVDWGTYFWSKLYPLKKSHVEKSAVFSLNPYTLLFERTEAKTDANREAEEEKLEKAGKFFQEQKYKQHHHPIHVAHTKYEREMASYLDNLSINESEKHDVPRGYLDTLSDAKISSWDAYKHQLEDAKPLGEVDELKEEVSALQTLMQIEQSMYQASNNALKLAVEAQTEELHQSTTNDEFKEFDQKLSTTDELKAFDKKAQEYEETVGKDARRMPSVEESKRMNLSG